MIHFVVSPSGRAHITGEPPLRESPHYGRAHITGELTLWESPHYGRAHITAELTLREPTLREHTLRRAYITESHITGTHITENHITGSLFGELTWEPLIGRTPITGALKWRHNEAILPTNDTVESGSCTETRLHGRSKQGRELYRATK